MAYTHGTVHAVPSSAIVAVAAPVGLSVALAGIPAGAGELFGQPPDYFDLARIALGTPDGFLPDVELRHDQNLLLPLPPGISQVGLSLAPGVTAQLTELVAAPDSYWSQNFEVSQTVAIGTTVAWTYTVPAGFELHLDGAIVSYVVESQWTTQGNIMLILRLKTGTVTLYLRGNSNVIGEHDHQALGTGPVLPAGQQLIASYAVSSVAQVVTLHLAAWGRLVAL